MKTVKTFINYFLLAGMLTFVPGVVNAGDVLRVDGSIATSGDGSSWSSSFKKLTDALSAAQLGDEIWVKMGMYQEPTYVLKEGVNVYGGFSGAEEKREQRVPKVNSTYLMSFNFVDQILQGVNTERITEWDGFTFTGGNNASKGGGIILQKNNKVSNSEITFNTSTSDGGGVNMTNAYLDHCIVSNNSGKAGAGVRIAGNSFITNCIVINNSGSNNGGGISGTDTPVVIENCLVANNTTSGGNGAGIILGDGRSGVAGRIVNCTVVRNKMTRPEGSKGCAGVFGSFAGSNPSSFLYNTIVWGNDATMGGGANNIAGYGTAPADIVKNCAIESIPSNFVNETNMDLSSDNTGSQSGVFYPNFVNPSSETGPVIVGEDGKYAYDWKITTGSACIDKGGNAYWTSENKFDLSGGSRIIGASIDMGAYEIGSASGTQRNLANAPIYIRKDGNTITIIGALPGELISIYNSQGSLIAQRKNSCAEIFTLDKGLYIIKAGKSTLKVVL